MQNHGFDGVVINFSHPAGIDEVAVRTMLKELRTHLLPTKTVAVFVPGDAALDYKALAAACDLVIVELFNEDPAEPGPLALASWSKNAAALRASDIPKEKLIFAIGVFGKDWSDLGGSQPISFNSVMLSAVMQSATIRFDRKSENPRLQFVDGDGHHHDTWFLDAVTFLSLIRDLTQLAPKGIALWEPGLGSEDESLWRLFQSKGFTNLPDPTVLEEIDAGHFIDTVGKGEIYRFLSRPKPGQRTITTTTSGELEEEYNTIPRPWQVQATGVLPHTIALTFDDGPEPEYTERILDILNREQVKATFFVTGGAGDQASRDHPPNSQRGP